MNAQPTPSAKSKTAQSDHLPPEHLYHTLKECDIVMKGGITSGVVYPSAVKELTKHYRLHSIGGTSAGAIAAAAAAAAELGRWHSGTNDSFDELAKLPDFLGAANCTNGNSNLFNLFQPQAQTKAIFDSAVAFLGDDRGKLERVLVTAIRSFPFVAAAGVLPGLLLLIVGFDATHWWVALMGLLLALIFGLIGFVLALVGVFLWQAVKGLNSNFFGFCTGMSNSNSSAAPPLTEWLADYLDKLAGISDKRTPLTFGDLKWGLGMPRPGVSDDPKPDYKVAPAINLNMITTNLTLGRPYSLPFTTHIFYFDPEEWRNFFPAHIVDWMVACSSQPDKSGNRKPEKIVQNMKGRILVPLPDGDDLPVVVATRMSLSFPILLSAVPVYVVDYTRKFNQSPAAASDDTRDADMTRREVVTAERCWFSDGGIAINFPIHFFDRPLPRWPTFAINLSVPHPDYPMTDLDEAEKIWMPADNSAGALPTWTRFQEKPTVAHLFGFLGSILYTARTWMDQMQMTSPGYRDRIVHIYLEADEGGLNLNMPKGTITQLAARGAFAAQKLITHFTNPAKEHVISWDNHRWIRYRTSMTMIEELLSAVATGYSAEMEGEPSYAELIARKADVAPKSYKLSPKAQKEMALFYTDSLVKLADAWQIMRQEANTEMADGTPSPKPEMQIRARI